MLPAPLVKAKEYFEWIDEPVAPHALREGQLVWSTVHVLLRGEDAAAPTVHVAAPAADAAAIVDGIIPQHPNSSCGEGRSRRKRKSVDYVSALVSTDLSDEMGRPQWLKKGTKLPSPEAVAAPDAAPEVGDCYWAAVEVVPDELAQDHPSVLVGSEVCVMAAAYPTDVFTRRSAIGWRGLVTHERGGASDPQVRIFGFWFRLADETFLKPVKQLTQGSRVE